LKLRRYLSFYILFTLVIALPALLLQYYGYNHLLVSKFWFVFFFQSGLTLVVIMAVIAGQEVNGERGTQMFLAATTFKILACLVFTLIFLLKVKPEKYIFVSNFFVIYLLNTAFEIYCLLRNLRNQNLR